MFGNTILSFEDNQFLEDVCINQENFDLEHLNICSFNQWQHDNPLPDKSFNEIIKECFNASK